MNAHTSIVPGILKGAPVPPIALLRSLPPGPLTQEYQRLQRLAELFAAFDRDDMEAGVELLIAELDARAGDPDAETGDLDGFAGEDDFVTLPTVSAGPGCEIADPDICIEHAAGSGLTGDRTYAEWDTLPSNQRRVGAIDGKPLDPSQGPVDEDAEDDDPTEANGDELDGRDAEDEHLTAYAQHYARGGPGCDVSDPGDATKAERDDRQDVATPRWLSDDDEPWFGPALMDGPFAANDQVPA